ncbi:MAG: hypothetical protein A3J66_03410 [Candidatus Magasanikbacteria bacterium RIFCSPHIGHO2_02_FULL_47_14]|uniref:Uncharacterized protein n=1 Tax=Candidatus Magasanikbacteria bacterium RIFCSPHIGHO2_02_FULL_47_14 TaxID=1798680 RepID=A0A1F6M8H7_9BACT|nr:MAG: hypothetical protein A3J66_03410 [Candidatus Magasanikbacteria bacterium RIFCSPHIGHO2_02_FULL_47_14]
MNDPEWSWVGQANGRRYMCGRAECTFEPLDGPDGCEAKCQPAFYRLVEELEHLDDLNFQYTDTGGGTWTCNAM